MFRIRLILMVNLWGRCSHLKVLKRGGENVLILGQAGKINYLFVTSSSFDARNYQDILIFRVKIKALYVSGGMIPGIIVKIHFSPMFLFQSTSWIHQIMCDIRDNVAEKRDSPTCRLKALRCSSRFLSHTPPHNSSPSNDTGKWNKFWFEWCSCKGRVRVYGYRTWSEVYMTSWPRIECRPFSL